MRKKVCISCGERLHHNEWGGQCDYGPIHADCFDEERNDNPDYECVEYVAQHRPKFRLHELLRKVTSTKKKRLLCKGAATKTIANNLVFINNLLMSEALEAIDAGDLQKAREKISAGKIAMQRYSGILAKMWEEAEE